MKPQKTDEIDDLIDQLVDLNAFPIDQPESSAYFALVEQARASLDLDGCVRFGQFIKSDYQSRLLAETEKLEPLALFSSKEYTPYGTPPDHSFEPGHPRNNTHRTTSGSVTRDLIPPTTLIQQLYLNPTFQHFIADCLDAEQIYPFRDPMRGLIINAMPDNTTLGWHFDANEFVVSLMTRRCDQGGEFEYCPNIRQPGAENYDSVLAVLNEERDRVKVLDLQVGDIQIFKGRFSMHRVATTIGRRQTVIFGYAREPGYIGSVESTLRIYGRVMQEHVDADHIRHSDGLSD